MQTLKRRQTLQGYRLAAVAGLYGRTSNCPLFILLSQRESFVTVKIFKSQILMNFDVFEVPESE